MTSPTNTHSVQTVGTFLPDQAPAPLAIEWTDTNASEVTVYHDGLSETGPSFLGKLLVPLTASLYQNSKLFTSLGVPEPLRLEAIHTHQQKFKSRAQSAFTSARDDTAKDDLRKTWNEHTSNDIVPAFLKTGTMDVSELKERMSTWLNDEAKVRSAMADVLGPRFVTRPSEVTDAANAAWGTLLDDMKALELGDEDFRSALTVLARLRKGDKTISYKPYKAFKPKATD